MSNQTYSDLLSKSANPGVLEQISDTELIGLHQLCKSGAVDSNNLVKRNIHSWLPLIEGEIVYRKEELLKAEDENELEKGGEGSKGGHVIGHTASGKPIYDSFTHASHEGFTRRDHEDAMTRHNSLREEEEAKGPAASDEEAKRHEVEGRKHYITMKNFDSRYKSRVK